MSVPGRRRGRQDAVINPPRLLANPSQRLRFRFSLLAPTDLGPLQVTRACLLNLLVVATGSSGTSNVLWPVIGGIKIVNVDLWQLPPTGGASAIPPSLQLEWLSNNGPPYLVSRTQMSSIATKFSTRPPVNSRAALWSNAEGNTSIQPTTGMNEPLFTIQYDANTSSAAELGAVIDIVADVVLAFNLPSFLTFTTAGAVNFRTGLLALPLDTLNFNGNLAGLASHPDGRPDALVSTAGVAITPTALVRTD
jgi:hypothetical protein